MTRRALHALSLTTLEDRLCAGSLLFGFLCFVMWGGMYGG